MTRPVLLPAEMLRLSLQTGLILAEAQMVIGMRMLGMLGLWRVLPSESARMRAEKVLALQEAAIGSAVALMSGKPAAKVAEAALKPVRRRTSANVKRLARRGPGKP